MPSSFPRRSLRAVLAALFVVAGLAAMPALASAATVVVNTTADNAPAPGQCSGSAGDCSLRQAIDMADGESGPTTIALPAGRYALTIPPTGNDNDSGDLNVKGNVAIQGAGARQSIIDASGIEDRALEEIEGDLRLVGLTITGGNVEGPGGGLFVGGGQATLEYVTVTDNFTFNSSEGGGIDAENGTSLRLRNSTVSHNRTSGDGGGIAFYGVNLFLEDSTIAENTVETALFPTNPGYGAYGGAMEAYGELMVMKNVTIAGNHIVDNNGGEEGSGAALESEFDTYEVSNTIIANNTASMVEEFGQCSDIAPIPSLGHNLETAAPAGEPRCFEEPTDLVANPLLGPLANNGGVTDTMALPAGSPAVDAGDPALCLLTDQRGVARDGACDIGAFEYVPPEEEEEEETEGTVLPSNTTTPTTSTSSSTTTPTTAAAPAAPGSFEFKGLKLNKKKGTAQLKVAFTGSGTATLSGKGVKKVTKSVAGGTKKFGVVAEGKAKKALAETGKAKVKVTVAFKTAANTVKKTKKIVLRLTT